MLGAIAGDIIGSSYEWSPIKTKNFELFSKDSDFTDDTVLTIATADALLNGKSYLEVYKKYPDEFYNRGYGDNFAKWASSEQAEPYNSFGNGSAMRVSPIGWFFDDVDKVLEEAKKSAEATHNHPEGVKGAQAVALAILLARKDIDKVAIKKEIQKRFQYDLNRTLEEIRPIYKFDVTCQGSVPEALIAFLESIDYEDSVRNAVSLGGDSDTQACIAGSVAEAYYGTIPDFIVYEALKRLDTKLSQILRKFVEVAGQK
ncbi:MAG: ADP-ribosylglycohydrolase family protein [bacterium]|nr:ADP-ribosylglycohydrolase family protein [bacterium]